MTTNYVKLSEAFDSKHHPITSAEIPPKKLADFLPYIAPKQRATKFAHLVEGVSMVYEFMFHDFDIKPHCRGNGAADTAANCLEILEKIKDKLAPEQTAEDLLGNLSVADIVFSYNEYSNNGKPKGSKGSKVDKISHQGVWRGSEALLAYCSHLKLPEAVPEKIVAEVSTETKAPTPVEASAEIVAEESVPVSASTVTKPTKLDLSLVSEDVLAQLKDAQRQLQEASKELAAARAEKAKAERASKQAEMDKLAVAQIVKILADAAEMKKEAVAILRA